MNAEQIEQILGEILVPEQVTQFFKVFKDTDIVGLASEPKYCPLHTYIEETLLSKGLVNLDIRVDGSEVTVYLPEQEDTASVELPSWGDAFVSYIDNGAEGQGDPVTAERARAKLRTAIEESR
jgi:hypothetical protein